MGGQKFEYDEQGNTFYYFLVSFYALVLIPVTYYFWPKRRKDDLSNEKRCRCKPCDRKEDLKKLKEPKKRLQKVITFALLAIGWIGFVAVAYKASTVEFQTIDYDPYEILGLDKGATSDEVKKQYRKLSMIHHPDRGGDAQFFVKLTKAHKALTDEEARKNWEMYGNPDGPGALTFGIALPSWIVSKEYGFWVLAVYGLIIMVLLPTVVGIWWYRSIKYSADQVLMDTTRSYFQLIHKTSFLNLKRLLMILGGSFEFCRQFNKEIVERPSDNEEVPKLMKQLPTTFTPARKEKPYYLGMEYSVKARALLYAHLSRLPLPPNSLEIDRQYVLRKSPLLIQEMISIYIQLGYMYMAGRAPRQPSLESLDNIFKLSPMIVQACWDNKSSLLQLPHFTEENLRHCINKKRHIKTCADLADMPDPDRQSLLRTFNKREYQDVINVLAMMPRVDMSVRVEVQDEDDKQTITAGSIATVIVSLKRTPLLDGTAGSKLLAPSTAMSSNSVPHDDDEDVPAENENPADGSDAETAEHDEADPNAAGASTQKKRPVWEKQKKGKKGAPKKKKPPQPQTKQAAAASQTSKAVVEAAAKPEEADGKQASPKKKKKAKPVGENGDDGSTSESGESDEESIALEPNNQDQDDDEDDLLLNDVEQKENILEAKSKITHPVHCPFFPEEKYEWWWVYLCDRKTRTMISMPVSVTALVHEEEVKLKFSAAKKGTYTYQVCLRSDSYLDMDQSKEIKIVVQEAKEVTSHPQWDFPSEDEEEKKSNHSDAESEEYTEEEDDENSS